LQLGISQPIRLQRLPGFVDPNRLLELQLHRRASRKVDAQIRRAAGDLHHGDQSQQDHEA
jgi:hypothetical protein